MRSGGVTEKSTLLVSGRHRLHPADYSNLPEADSSETFDNMTGCCRRPRIRDFGFRTDNAGDFTRAFCQCCNNKGCRGLWALYRLFLPIWYIGYIVWYGAFFNGVGGKALTFLTNWTVWGFTLYVIMAAGNLIWDRLCTCAREGSMYEADEPDVGIRHALQWLLFTIFCNGEIIVAVVYWSLLHDGVNDTEEWIHDTTAHLAPAIFSLIDVLFSATPVRLLHFIYTIAFGLTYFIFALIYWAAGGTGTSRDENGEFTSYIYSFLNFSDSPAMAVAFLIGLCIVTTLMHVAIWGVYRFKRYLANCENDGRSEEAANAEFTMVKTSSNPSV